jgi:pyrroloquinoline quinone (PQQ) biosynthesis protein C
VRAGEPAAATELMVAYVYDYIARVNPAGMLGMVHVLEGTSSALATRAAQAIARALRLPQSAFTYLTSHGSLDQEHVEFFKTTIEGLTVEDRSSTVHVARRVYRLYGDVFRSLPA